MCSYLIPSLWTAGWKEDPKVRWNINVKITTIPQLKKAVERVQKKAEENKKKSSNTQQNKSSSFNIFQTSSTKLLNFEPFEPSLHSIWMVSTIQPLNSTPFTSTKQSSEWPTLLTAAAISSQSAHPLCHSFIADNGANTHVVNCFYEHQMKDICPARPGLVLLHGNTSTPIQAFGTVYFNTKDVSSKCSKHWI